MMEFPEFEETSLRGICVHTPKNHPDPRGTTSEIFNLGLRNLAPNLKNLEITQILEATSTKGVIRGIHFSARKNPQVKVVRCIAGKIKDILIDLRIDSSTFGEFEVIELESDKCQNLIISPGFGHSYQVISDTATVIYALQTNFNFSQEYSINPLDEELNLPWSNIPVILSERDLNSPTYAEAIEKKSFE
jgi:dTDP-4-dehydrorhamnose 3,5-epimerase